jgi:hypothetical protein
MFSQTDWAYVIGLDFLSKDEDNNEFSPHTFFEDDVPQFLLG